MLLVFRLQLYARLFICLGWYSFRVFKQPEFTGFLTWLLVADFKEHWFTAMGKGYTIPDGAMTAIYGEIFFPVGHGLSFFHFEII